MASINLILIVCLLTNDSMGHNNPNRHIPDILQNEVCEKIFRIVDMIGQVPSLNDMFN